MMMIRVNRGSPTKRSSKRRRRIRRRGQRSKEVIKMRVTRVKRAMKKFMTLVFHQVRGS
jgi:guanylate kinase